MESRLVFLPARLDPFLRRTRIIRIDEPLDQPRAGHTVDFDVLPRIHFIFTSRAPGIYELDSVAIAAWILAVSLKQRGERQ